MSAGGNAETLSEWKIATACCSDQRVRYIQGTCCFGYLERNIP